MPPGLSVIFGKNRVLLASRVLAATVLAATVLAATVLGGSPGAAQSRPASQRSTQPQSQPQPQSPPQPTQDQRPVANETRPLPEIVASVQATPPYNTMDYIGVAGFQLRQRIYVLRFIDGRQVVVVHVDARSGRIIGRSP